VSHVVQLRVDFFSFDFLAPAGCIAHAWVHKQKLVNLIPLGIPVAHMSCGSHVLSHTRSGPSAGPQLAHLWSV